MKLAVWSPLPPATSGIADYVAESVAELQRVNEVELVCPEPETVDPSLRARASVRAPGAESPADLDIYHLGNSPAHAFVYRAALARPGVVVLHDWNLHHLVLSETVERGDPGAYLRQMRRTYGEKGTFVGRQVASALGGDLLPALFPLSESVLEASLAVVALSRSTAERTARCLPGRPVLHLPLHLALPFEDLPTQVEARRSLGLPERAFVVTSPGLATSAKRIEVTLRVLGRLRSVLPDLRFVVAGGVEAALPLQTWLERYDMTAATTVTGRLGLPDFVRHLRAADVVVALRFPSFGEMSATLVRAMGVGRPVLVTAGTPPAEEMPEGTVVPVDPGAREGAELRAVLLRLAEDADLRERIGELAQAHVRDVHDLRTTVERLDAFLLEVDARKADLRALAADSGPAPETTLGAFKEEVRWGARDLGLGGVPLGLDALLAGLAGEKG